MANNNTKNTIWFLVVIEDPNSLPGTSIYKIIRLLQKLLNIKYVGLSDLEGAGINNLVKKDEQPLIEIELFLKRVQSVEQFDWGDFFLFSSPPNDGQPFTQKTYPEMISLTETTIRAIDDSYIYIYTPNESINYLIQKNYQVEEVKAGKLEELEYPF